MRIEEVRHLHRRRLLITRAFASHPQYIHSAVESEIPGIQLNSETPDERRTLWFDPINAKTLMYAWNARRDRSVIGSPGGCVWKEKQVAVYTHTPPTAPTDDPEGISSHFKLFQATS